MLACALTTAHGASDAPSDLAALIARAQPGETIRIGTGNYRGVVTIDKPLTLEGVGRPVIRGSGRGDLLLITASDVTVRGIDFVGTGDNLDQENCAIRVLAPRATLEDNRLEDVLFGIDLRGAPDSVVRGNTIGGKPLDIARRGDGLRLWKCDRTRVEGNTIHDGRDAVLWYSTDVEVRGNLVRNCRYGFHLMYSHGVRIEHNDLHGNSVGIYLMYSDTVDLRDNRIASSRGASGFGIGLKEVSDYRVERNMVAGNCVGIYIDAAPFRAGQAEIRANAFVCNDAAFAVLPNVKGNVVVNNAFVDNLHGLTMLGRGDLYANAFDRNGAGNFWSDYCGYDENGDGIGEWVHEPEPLFGALLQREPKLAVLRFSPSEQVVEFVARAVPAMRPHPLFADENPRTSISDEARGAWNAGRKTSDHDADEGGHSAVWAAVALLFAAGLAALGGLT